LEYRGTSPYFLYLYRDLPSVRSSATRKRQSEGWPGPNAALPMDRRRCGNRLLVVRWRSCLRPRGLPLSQPESSRSSLSLPPGMRARPSASSPQSNNAVRFTVSIRSRLSESNRWPLHTERGTAHKMLAEATRRHLRADTVANLRGTPFGPVNAKINDVNVAVSPRSRRNRDRIHPTVVSPITSNRAGLLPACNRPANRAATFAKHTEAIKRLKQRECHRTSAPGLFSHSSGRLYT
jgi:hypothetical protein